MTTATLAVHVRHASTDDRLDLAEMLLRCSVQTRYRRFHGFLDAFPEPYFTSALADQPGHLALVAETPTRIVALASLVTVTDDTAELGLLVEDSYQRQGIGTRLLSTLVEHRAHRTIKASILPDQIWILPLLRRYKITIE